MRSYRGFPLPDTEKQEREALEKLFMSQIFKEFPELYDEYISKRGHFAMKNSVYKNKS